MSGALALSQLRHRVHTLSASISISKPTTANTRHLAFGSELSLNHSKSLVAANSIGATRGVANLLFQRPGTQDMPKRTGVIAMKCGMVSISVFISNCY